MPAFKAKKEDLKKALSIVSLATGDKTGSIEGHALFSVSEGKTVLRSTDQNRIAFSVFQVDGSDSFQFTADPKKLVSLINSSDSDLIQFDYDPISTTLNIYASENEASYVSLPSFKPEEFLSFEEEIEKTHKEKNIDAGTLQAGFKFITGFLPNDEKNKKFSCVYLAGGALYGSNGSDKIGTYNSSEFDKIPEISFRKGVLSQVSSFIDKTKADDITLKTTSKIILITTTDEKHGFGFRKTIVEMPKFPISTSKPGVNPVNIDRNLMNKKLKRLSIASGTDIGIKILIETDSITMETLTERKSVEKMPCKGSQTEKMEFVIQQKMIENISDLFQASNIDLYFETSRCTLRSEGNLQIQREDKQAINKPFIAVGVISLARVL